MKSILTSLIVTSLYLFFQTSTTFSQSVGTLKGIILDSESGDKLISATVFIKNTKLGAHSKHDGSFIIKNIPVGSYDVEISYIGYKKYELKQIQIKANQTESIEIKMQSNSVSSGEVYVTAKATKESNETLLKDRKKANAFTEAIGSQDMSKLGNSDAADAMKKVTGASIVGGKHLYIRGLGDRYAKTELNGASLPSADPDKRSVHLDMFSAGVIENITLVKTATPDRPGDFTGGAVDIITKSYPDKFFTNLSISSGYNSQVTGSNVLLSSKGDLDWLATDDGSRSIPNAVQNAIKSEKGIPNGKTLFLADRDLVNAQNLINLTKAFNANIAPVSYNTPINQSINLSFGNKYTINKSPFGFLANINYSQNYENYSNGKYARYNLLGIKNESLFPSYIAKDMKGSQNVNLGGFTNLSYTFLNDNEISLNLMFNKASENFGMSQTGFFNSSGIPNRGFQTYASKFTEKSLFTYQFKGKHNFTSLINSKLDWNISLSGNDISTPDLKFFAYDFNPNNASDISNLAPNEVNPSYTINKSAYNEPTRMFRKMTENVYNLSLNYEIPLKEYVGNDFIIKVGALSINTERDFKESRFVYNSSSNQIQKNDINGNPYTFDPNTLLNSMTGTIIKGNFIEMPMFISYFAPELYSYTASMNIFAYYGMIDFKMFKKLRIITGIRVESSDLKALPYDKSKIDGYKEEYKEINNIPESQEVNITFNDFGIDETDILPSLNLVYELNEKSNIRSAYSKTLARPNLREIAPYSSFDFVGGFIYLGNPFLKRSLIDNFDLRYEWFPNIGEIFSASIFYKNIDNPIELNQPTVNDQVRYQNSKRGTILGAEFEIKKNIKNTLKPLFKEIPDWTEYFTYSINLALTHSEVEIPDGREKTNLMLTNPNAKLTREFLGQSPYVVNFDIMYSNYDLGTDLSLNFNVFGKRLTTVMFGITPDIYENPRPDLNFVFSQKIYDNWNIKFAATNLLNSYTLFAQDYKGSQYETQKYLSGRQFNLSLSYKFN